MKALLGWKFDAKNKVFSSSVRSPIDERKHLSSFNVRKNYVRVCSMSDIMVSDPSLIFMPTKSTSVDGNDFS